MSSVPPATLTPGFHDTSPVAQMSYNQLGTTDMWLSKLALGGGPFGNLYGDVSEETAIKLIQTALKRGINYIDTAYWYGQGRSETVLGKALAGVPRQAYYIGTKIGRYEKDYPNRFDFSPEKVVSSVDASLSRLGLPYVDIIQIHDLEFAPSPEYIINHTLPALQKIVEGGKARYIGITGYPLAALKTVAEQSSVKIHAVLSYCRETLFDRTLDDYLEFFHAKGIGVLNAAPTAMGLLTPQGPQAWHPASADLKAKCRQASEMATQAQTNICRLAFADSLKSEGIASTIVGMNDQAILDQNLDCLNRPLTSGEGQCLENIIGLFGTRRNHWEGVELARYKEAMSEQK